MIRKELIMKIEIEIEEEVESEIVYPCLMKTDYGAIVLFHKYKNGVVLKARVNNFVGYYSDNWDMPTFSPFKGKITLSND